MACGRRDHQRGHGGGGFRLFPGGQAAEVLQGGTEGSVAVEPGVMEQLVDGPLAAGACNVSHDLPGFF
jgi:hypothetical protein